MILRAALQDRGKRGEKALSCSQRTEERQLRLAQRENFFPHSNDTCFAVSSEEEAHHRRLSLVERGAGDTCVCVASSDCWKRPWTQVRSFRLSTAN